MPIGTKSNIRTRQGLSTEDTDQAWEDLVDNLLAQVTGFVETETGRDFDHHQNAVLELDGNGRSTLRLGVYPVIAVHRVEIDGITQDEDEYRVTDAGILEKRSSVWPQGWENILVELDHGFEKPPGDVELIVENVVIRILRNAGEDQSVKSISMDGFSITRGEFEEELTEQDRKALKKWKKPRQATAGGA
ncbi:hypothetical protein BRD56_05410 [Thermoplasmatales archaeon SW_10_69_26]|nr:MAG: hypothetical protein BRD56_05410 [Thermoplasmatales archaeon SW_10_69_26]